MITNKFRLYPNKTQESQLNETLIICRFTYNKLLEKLSTYKKGEINRSEIQHHIVELKKNNDFMNDVYSKTLQYENYRLFSNLRALSQSKKKGRKVGRLRFKGKEWFKTFTYNQSGFMLDQEDNKLKLSKIGKIKIRNHRLILGEIKQITIKKEEDNWYACITSTDKPKIECNSNKIIALDFGINSYITDQFGNKLKSPEITKMFALKIRKLNKELSRRKKGSKNRNKTRKKLNKIHKKIFNKRDNFLHKLSTHLVRNNRVIILEKLNIKQLTKISYNPKNLLDNAWNKFTTLLNYKAESAGVQVVYVNPRNTTKMCSNCGNIQKVPLWERTYKCQKCNFILDRDTNAARNILNLGKEITYVENNSSIPLEQELSMKQEAITSTEC